MGVTQLKLMTSGMSGLEASYMICCAEKQILSPCIAPYKMNARDHGFI